MERAELVPVPDHGLAGEASAGEDAGGRSLPGVRDALAPFSRAGGYYARSWRRYLGRRPGTDLPVVRPTVALAGQAFLDEVVLAGFRMVLPVPGATELARIDAEATAAAGLYREAGWLDTPERFFATPPPLEEVTIRPARGPRQHDHERLSFDSGYEPWPGEPGRQRWLDYEANRRARAWVLRHDEPRPWLVCIHGARMGRPNLDLALFRARWLHEDLGLNVLLPLLPLHGVRQRGLAGKPSFPGQDILDNVHGAAQSVWDVRRMLSWIRAEHPGVPVGLNGLSLGGYVSALVAGLEDGLACAILGVPAVDLVDLIEHHAGFRPGDERWQVVERAKQIGPVVSPLALTPRVPPAGRFVYAGLADRLVHPRRQVLRLWEHWGRPEIAWYRGSHTGFSRSKPIGGFIRDALVRSGLVGPSGRPRTI
jgi:hypothetical protein